MADQLIDTLAPELAEPDLLEQAANEEVEQLAEPLLATPSAVNDQVAQLVAAQVSVIRGDTTQLDKDLLAMEENYLATLTEVKERGTSGIKQQLAMEEASMALSLFEKDALIALQEGRPQSESIKLATEYHLGESRALEETIIEQKFVDGMLELLVQDPANAQLISDVVEFNEKGSAFERLMDTHMRSLLIHRMTAEINQSREDHGVFHYAFDSVINALNMRDWYTLFKLDPPEGFTKGEMAKSFNELFYNIPSADLPTFMTDFFQRLKDSSGVFGVNESQMLQTLEDISNISPAELSTQTSIGFMEVFDITTLAAFPLMKVGSKALILTRLGQRATAETSILKTLADEIETPSILNEVSKDVASDAAVPSAAKALEPLAASDVANSAGVVIQSNQDRARRIVESIARDERILDDDRVGAIEAALKGLRDEYGASAVTDFNLIPTNTRGVTTVSIAIGTKKGGAFGTEAMAESAKILRRLPDDASVFKSSEGKWFIKLNRDVDEAFILEKNFTDSPYNPLSKYLINPNSAVPQWLRNRAESAGSLKGAFVKAMQPITKIIRKLPKSQYKDLSRVILDGNITNKKWFNKAEFDAKFVELNKKLPNDNQWAGYRAFVDLNDIDWGFRNWEMFSNLRSRGFKTGRVDFENLKGGSTSLKQVEDLKDVDRMSIYDADTGTMFSGRGRGTDAIKEQLKKGYELFSIHGERALADGSGSVNAILVRSGRIKLGLLKTEQLPYRAGGHRAPEGTYFIKQARVGTFTGAGEGTRSYLRNPLTHASGRTRSALTEYTERMNQSLLEYQAYKAAGKAGEAVEEGSKAWLKADNALREAGFEDGLDEFAKKVDDGAIDPDHRFEIVENNENPVPNMAPGSDVVDMRNVNSFTSFVETQGRPYYGRRGTEPLRGPDDEIAKLIDPVRVLSKSLADGIHRGNLSNYRIAASDAWMNTFGNILKGGNGQGARGVFFSKSKLTPDDFDPHANKGFVNAAINQHFHMQTQLKAGNSFGNHFNAAATRLANFIDKKGGEATAGKVLDWRDANPASALRGIAYNVNLGLFAVDQLFIQSQTAISMALLDPLKAHQHINRGLHFQVLNMVTSDEALNKLAKTFADPEDFKEMVKIGRERGIIDLFGDMSDLDHNALFNVGGKLSLRNIAQKGRMFVMAAERFNKSVGYAKAWDELRAIHSLKKMRTSDVQQELATLASKYSMNMSTASAARWQKNAFGIPTQFLSYPIKYMENMTTSKQWTFGQKVKLGLTQGILYGGGGVGFLGGATVFDPVLSAMGLDPKEDREAYILARGGVMDWALSSLLGESNISNRVGLSNGIREWAKSLTGDDIQQSSFFGVATGAVGSLVWDGGKALWDVGWEAPAIMLESVRAERSGIGADFVVDKFMRVAVDNLNVANDLYKVYWAIKTGEYLSSRHGSVLAEGLSNAQAIGIALGVTPGQVAEGYLKKDMLQDSKEAIKDAAQPLILLRNEEHRLSKRYFALDNADPNGPEKQEIQRQLIDIMERKNFYIGGLPEDRQMDIIRYADRSTDRGVFIDDVAKQFDKHFNRPKIQ